MVTRRGLFILVLLVACAGEHDIGVVADVDVMVMDMDMESESTRRQLGDAGDGYISYMALARNRVPCDQPGTSYYNCRAHQRANPYNRGCTRATSCARTTR